MRVALIAIYALAILTACAACKRAGGENNSNNTNNSAGAADDTSQTPPFSTKEPERYQWTTVTTVSVGDGAQAAGGSVNTTISRVVVARDGELRREDYEMTPGVKISYLQIPAGRYRLLHSKKVYAELKSDESSSAPGQTPNLPSDFSPDRLLNASRTEARYEKLGAEEVNGRNTTKYRVTIKSGIGEAKDAVTENLIWVDETLGVPIKTETTQPGGSRYTMEVQDIKQEVDASVFALPPDYKRVDSKEIDTEMLSTYMLGGDTEESNKQQK
jgi:hypothetical protein